jgi:hypothetical protein
VLAGQLLTQTLTALYFCAVDAVLMWQLFYYSKLYRGHEEGAAPLLQQVDAETEVRRGGRGPGHSLAVVVLLCTPLFHLLQVDALTLSTHSTRSLLSNTPPNCMFTPHLSRAERIVGSLLAWCSGLLYFFSRYAFAPFQTLCFRHELASEFRKYGRITERSVARASPCQW